MTNPIRYSRATHESIGFFHFKLRFTSGTGTRIQFLRAKFPAYVLHAVKFEGIAV